MKKRTTATARLLIVLSFVLVLSGAGLAQSNSHADTLRPPMTEKKTKTTKIHNDTMVDDYFWLREKSNPEVIAHLEAENAYAEAAMKPTAALQDKLYKEMVGHIKETDRSVPYQWGGYFYYTRTEEGKQYPINCRKKGGVDASEEIVLDQNQMAKGLKFFSVGAFVPSDDGNLLAYSTDTTGYRQYKLQIKDLRTGQLLPEAFERVGNVAWATDNKTIFFTTEDATTKRSDKFYGLPELKGAGFQRVKVADGNRGGVVTMAGVLTLTSYPRRSSPVLRGRWLMEEILGSPPPPAPPMIKSLPTSDKPRNGQTFRQQLEQHRNRPECASCHKTMDQLGFGLENFSPIGQWRTAINDAPVDNSGELPNGQKFSGPVELKALLAQRKDEFTRNLAERMMSYALGRGIEQGDWLAIRQISKAVATGGYKSQDLILGIIRSPQFNLRRPAEAPKTAAAAR